MSNQLEKHVFRHLEEKTILTLPFSNEIKNIIHIDNFDIIVDYGNFAALLDSKTNEECIIDNYDGEYRCVFSTYEGIHILSSTCVTTMFPERRVHQVKAYDAYEQEENILVFIRENIREIEVYELEMEMTMLLRAVVKRKPYCVSMYNDPMLEVMTFKVIYSTGNYVEIEKYDLNKCTMDKYRYKCAFDIRRCFDLGEDMVYCETESIGYLYHKSNSMNNFHDFRIKGIIETGFMPTINSLYIRMDREFYIVGKQHIDGFVNENVDSIREYVETKPNCKCFEYDEACPKLSKCERYVIYINEGKLNISETKGEYKILGQKKVDNDIEYTCINLNENNYSVSLGTCGGDIIIYSIG